MKKIIDVQIFMANPKSYILEKKMNYSDSVNIKDFISYFDLNCFFGISMPNDNIYSHVHFNSRGQAQKFIDDELMPRIILKKMCE